MLGVCHKIALRKDEYIFLTIKNDILVKLLNTLVKDHTLSHFLHTLVLKYIYIQRSDSAFVLKREKKLNSVTISFKHLKTNKKYSFHELFEVISECSKMSSSCSTLFLHIQNILQIFCFNS